MPTPPSGVRDDVVAWLLDGDSAVRQQVRRDLLGTEGPGTEVGTEAGLPAGAWSAITTDGDAAVLLAARIAAVPWDAAPAVRRYLRWALLREDLPPSLRGRCDAVEAYFAHPGAPWLALGGLVPWWSRGSGLLAAPARVVGRCASNAAALLYGALMPSDDRGLG